MRMILLLLVLVSLASCATDSGREPQSEEKNPQALGDYGFPERG